MEFYINNKQIEVRSFDEFISKYKKDLSLGKFARGEYKITNYHIPGGTGDMISEAFIGVLDDFNDFCSSIEEDMIGWTEYGQPYTLAWHDGEFIDIYNCLEETKTQIDENCEEYWKDEKVTVWRNFIDYNSGEEIYIYGIL